MKPSFSPEYELIIRRFIKDYFQSSGASGLIIGLSGGLDSTVVLKLAADAVGPEKIKGLLMPDASTPRENMSEIREYADSLGVENLEIDITETVASIMKATPSEDKTALGNVKARARMQILYHQAGLEGRLVLGTGNKSEMLTGYFTKYGDGASDFSPIGDLYKTQVRELARHIGVPAHFIEKTPSGDLWIGQSDEAELGITYDELDMILMGIEAGLGDSDIRKRTGQPLEKISHVRNLVARSVHKRRLGLVPKIGLRTVGLDWREA